MIPGAGEQVRIEGGAHFLQEDRGDQIAEHVLRFLASAS
jgi:haloalkane dehalogenase